MSSRLVLTGWAIGSVMSFASVAIAGDLRLVQAAQRQDRLGMEALLREHVDVNVSQADGATALHWAAYRDDVETAELLLRFGADANAANDYGVTPLSLAATNGSVGMIDSLLKAGAKPNLALPTGETPLMAAARTGKIDAVRRLLAAGADPDAKESSKGQNALMWAVAEQHRDVVQMLIEHGSSVNARSDSGFTPLMFATREGNLDLVRLLMGHGARVNETANDGVSVLHVATVRGHAELAMFLLDQGADPNASLIGYTALHWASGKWETWVTRDYPSISHMGNEWAAMRGVPAQQLELVKALLKHGADPNARITKKPPRFGDTNSYTNLIGATPFFVAAMSADTAVMRVLLAGGADPTLKTKDNQTALMAAAGLGRSAGETLITEREFLDAVRLCVEAGVDVNAVDNAGDTALHATAFLGEDSIAQFLVENHASLNLKNNKGETPTKAAEETIIIGVVRNNPRTAALLRKLGGKTE